MLYEGTEGKEGWQLDTGHPPLGLHHLVFGSISSLSLEVAGGARESGSVTGWLQAGKLQSGQVYWWLRDWEVKGQEVERPRDQETARRAFLLTVKQ